MKQYKVVLTDDAHADLQNARRQSATKLVKRQGYVLRALYYVTHRPKL